MSPCKVHCSRKGVNAAGVNKGSADLWVKNSLLPFLLRYSWCQLAADLRLFLPELEIFVEITTEALQSSQCCLKAATGRGD